MQNHVNVKGIVKFDIKARTEDCRIQCLPNRMIK
ncbi:hypothetical protein EDC21_10733 [Thermohydrogenium kirishiense]|nr:hypothetical protein EDC21_10733 [Thermohydrogenium kirishiense]